MNEKINFKKLKKRIRRRTIFFLIFALMANTFAWFIYTNKVDNNLTTGVRSWKINFNQNGTEISDHVEFNIDKIYPGMPNYSDSFSINNDGETTALLTFELNSIKIMDETYTDDNYTSDELLEILNNNYPFKITFSSTSTEISNGEKSEFSVNLVWPYESGDDEADTYWGKKSATFSESNPDENQIEIKATITATQKND